MSAPETTSPSGIASLVMGTAGHIDHGKSSLVRRLTGKNPDRLKEEQERELTIDLGFAPYALPDGRTLGIIDVPGHERFVKNMVAGASGIDLVLLVVAADDGVMPQTREHLEILTLLGIEHGLVVITKIDLPGIDEDLLELLEMELEELLEGTFLAGAPVQRVSSATGQGFDELEATIEAAVARIPPHKEDGPFRMPVQRVFSAKGFGTVLTGVPLEGAVSQGDEVEVLTQAGRRLKARVRGTQAYGQKVERVRAGHSSALNLSDVDYKEVVRGDVVCTPKVFAPAAMWEVRLDYLASQPRPLKQRDTVRLHVGTAEVIGEVIVLEAPVLEPGQSGLCQIRLRHPVVAAPNDRFVVRRHSPMETIGGGVILGASKHRLKPGKEFVLQRLEAKSKAVGQAEEQLLVELGQAREPLLVERLVELLQRPRDELQQLLGQLVEGGQVIEISAGKGRPGYLSAEGFAAARRTLREALAKFHKERPVLSGCERQALKKQLELHEGLFQTALQALLADGELSEPYPQRLALSGHQPQPGEPAQAYRAQVLEALEQAAFQPPPQAELEESLPEGLSSDDAADVFTELVVTGELVAVHDDVVLHQARYVEAQERLTQRLSKGPAKAAELREALETTRKFIIPILEHFDSVGLTRREGDVRVLRGR